MSLYNIKHISEHSGVKTATLRMWEKRYGLFSPTRSEGGHRLYNAADLHLAYLLGKLTHQGHNISNLSQLKLKELEKLDKSSTNENIHKPVQTTKLFELLKNFDYLNIHNEFQNLRLSKNIHDYLFEVIIPSLQQAGNMVKNNTISISQEHIISTIIRDQLNQLKTDFPLTKSSHICIATPENNYHELPILITEILCKRHGFCTHNLGPSHPPESLTEALNVLNPKLLILGVTPSNHYDYHNSISQFLKKIDQHIQNDLNIFLGGATELIINCRLEKINASLMTSFNQLDQYLEKHFI